MPFAPSILPCLRRTGARVTSGALVAAVLGTGCSDTSSKASPDGGRTEPDGASGSTAAAGTGGTLAGDGGSRTGSSGGSAGGGAGAAGGMRTSGGSAGASNASGGDAGDASGATPIDGGAGGRRLTESPWGVAPSHSSSVGIDSWAAPIAAAGIDWIRGFDGDHTDAVLKTATDDGFQVSGILFFSDPGPTATFPVNSIPQWKDYVTNTVGATRGKVHHYEVWNEPPNFSANTSPADYAKIVVAAYDAAKAADPTVQVGLAAQSVNLNFMAQALDAGAAGHFDYVTVHPYETMGLVASGHDAEYMSIVPTIHKLLADKDPKNAGAPVWFTEVGEPVQGGVTAEDQADTLVKAYVMGIAQGALRIHWFEPLDGDSGPFGLIGGGSGSSPKRPSYTAVAELIRQLGHTPGYTGWLLLDKQHYAFVFEGASGPVMIAWAPPKVTAKVDLGGTVHVTDLHTGATKDVASIDLTNSPVLVTGFAESFVRQAQDDFARPFPWGGDYSSSSSVSYTAASGERGLHPIGDPALITVDNGPALDVSKGPGLSFTVDPNFISYTATKVRVTAVLRRNGTDSAGFNLKYESTTGWKGTGSWYTVPGSDQWYTQTWEFSDTQFVGKWGYNFAFDSDSTQNSKYDIQSVTVTKL